MIEGVRSPPSQALLSPRYTQPCRRKPLWNRWLGRKTANLRRQFTVSLPSYQGL